MPAPTAPTVNACPELESWACVWRSAALLFSHCTPLYVLLSNLQAAACSKPCGASTWRSHSTTARLDSSVNSYHLSHRILPHHPSAAVTKGSLYSFYCDKRIQDIVSLSLFLVNRPPPRFKHSPLREPSRCRSTHCPTSRYVFPWATSSPLPHP